MAPRPAKPRFLCSACGDDQPRWFGRCPACGAWNTAVEAPAAKPEAARARWAPGGGREAPRPLAEVESGARTRSSAGIAELDRVLGGGIVAGSLVLVGGDPGIGKSTLLLQLARAVAAPGGRALVASGEESEEQIRMRAARLGPIPPSLLVMTATDLDAILEAAGAARQEGAGLSVLVVDSIQTLQRASVEGGPGTPTQVRECGLALLEFAKSTGIPVMLVGHVTKDGGVAGPRTLEHLVDAVLYLEGERYRHYRTLRAAKNRFGSTEELGVFEMTEAGLVEVQNPSAAFLSDSDRVEPGTAAVASLEGTRPLLVEVQALVSASFYASPQRVTHGFDPRRLAVLLAVLERRVGLRLGRHDVFVTVTGGLRLEEPGTDLGVALAVASSQRGRPVRARTLLVGEVSLAGEVRRVTRLEARVREAAQLGFQAVAVPAAQAAAAPPGIEIVPVATLREAIATLLGPRVPSDPGAATEPDSASAPRPALRT